LSQWGAGARIAHFGARRDREVDVVRGRAGLGLALAVLAPLRLPDGAIAVVEQGREVRIRPDEDAAAVSAVAAVGTALGPVLEPGERRSAGAPGARRDLHHRALDEAQGPGLQPSRTLFHSSFTFFH